MKSVGYVLVNKEGQYLTDHWKFTDNFNWAAIEHTLEGIERIRSMRIFKHIPLTVHEIRLVLKRHAK